MFYAKIIDIMSEERGFLYEEQEEFILDAFDKAYNPKSLILEFVDRPLGKVVINTIDDFILENISRDMAEELKKKIRDLVQAALTKDKSTFESLGSELINERVDIPLIEEPTEAVIYRSLLGFLYGLLLSTFEKEDVPPEELE